MKHARALARRVLPLLVFALAFASAPEAQVASAPQVRVILRPAVAKLGERVVYRVELIGGFSVWQPPAWMAPDSGTAFSWGEPRQGVTKGHTFEGVRFGPRARRGEAHTATPDTAWVEIPLQVFELGIVSIPGLGFRYQASGATPAISSARAPIARLIVMPVLTAADSNATLRPLHGPLAAPWWERVPWPWVIGGLLLLVLLALAIRTLRRRRVKAPAAAPARAPLSPAAAALQALAELRALDLPGQGRFSEHAFRLGQILRRYLEATVSATHPGDTTPELVRHLREAGLSSDDVKRLAGLLRVWDRVKFAREAFTHDEAVRAESAVEGFVRRALGPASAEAA
ncbi:MAG: DUF4381 family protein [Candidatus Eisenbacteria bacterium]|uniref:DUF4381 family protein n=1 Tax=Eiseniibacteriota bacterium TaxID=2212470 RepID=A0A538TYL4_UNCEI|nr:MAG: DUF4381 family protein [Candidatus Eisenbacteria bacterium]